jgi:hypothetical protein
MALTNTAKLPKDASGAIMWSSDQQKSFATLKAMILAETVLFHPSFISRPLTPAERAHTVYELETLAVYWATTVFDWYLWSQEFLIRTDSNAVEYVLGNCIKGRMRKWALALQELKYKIEHRPGCKHGNADAMSRYPLEKCSDCPYGAGNLEPLHGSAPPFPVSTVTRSSSTTNPRRHYETPSVNDDEKEDLMDTDDAPPIRFRRQTTIAMDEKPDSDSDSDEQEDPDAARAVIPAAYFPPSDYAYSSWLINSAARRTMAAIQESGVTWGTIHKPRVPGPVPRADNTKSIFIINNEALLNHRANGGPPCVVVPEAFKAFILLNHHGVPFVGHCGANKVRGHMRK